MGRLRLHRRRSRARADALVGGLDVDHRQTSSAILTRAGLRAGARELLPAAPAVLVMALAFGVAAGQAGMPGPLAIAMSTVVYAGASQYVALGMWHAPLPFVPVLVATFAVNSRFILLSAALSRWLAGLSWRQRALAVTLLGEANWAAALRAEQRGDRDAGVLLGGGLLLWSLWIVGTVAGVLAGPLITQPERYGLDLVLVLFFVNVLVDGWRGPSDLLPWCVAGAAASLPPSIVPPQWSVLVGAVSGAAVGAWRDGR